MRIAVARLARFLLAFGLCAASAACGGGTQNATVTVIIPWTLGSSEYNAFQAVITPFEDREHTQVILEPAQDVTRQLDADLAANTPPDVVDLSNPAAVIQYEKSHKLRPLNGISLSSYDEPWRSLAESPKGTVYAIPVKADVKSLIWYNAHVLRSPPKTWAALQDLSRHGTPWCLGLDSGSGSGWPGDDWVADILLSMSGNTDKYEEWLSGQLGWTSSQVKDAWQTWGTLMRSGAAVYGNTVYALETRYNSHDFEAAMTAGRCELERGALTATGLNPAAGNHLTFTLFPPISGTASPLLVSGDFMGQFSANPNATALLKYLAGPAAQSMWVKQPGAYAFSADNDEGVSAAYPAGVQRQIADLLKPDPGKQMCFSAEDMMTPEVSTAFSQAVLEYVDDPGSLTNSLRGLQKTQQAAGSSPAAKLACASP